MPHEASSHHHYETEMTGTNTKSVTKECLELTKREDGPKGSEAMATGSADWGGASLRAAFKILPFLFCGAFPTTFGSQCFYKYICF